MKKIQLLAIGTGLFTLSALNNANAVDSGIIDFTGTIVASLCTPDFNGTDTQTVPLGMYPIDTFTGAGDKSDLKDIALSFTGCPASTATLTFKGTPDTTDNTLLQVTPGAGTATNVAIALFENDGTTKISLNVPTADRTLTAGDNTLNFKAAYQALTAGVTAGTANGTATLDIVYN
ncbi:MAG: fimbrial protein [Yersinia sp. (in: enterobacteria)]|jgi:major type 1 subunit fimbrin (pilin)